MVCWVPHGFASQVRAAHVFFRCPPGRDGDGPEDRGWEPPGWEVPSRPGWGGRGEALLGTGRGQYSVIAVEHVELHLHLFCCVSRSSVELCGVGEQGRDDTSPNPL